MRPVDAPSFVYRGGKARLRTWISRWAVYKGQTYCEPFAGRANVFFLMKTVSDFTKWHLNDIRTFKFLNALASYEKDDLPSLDVLNNKQQCKVFMENKSEISVILEPLLVWAGGLYHQGASVTGVRNNANLSNYMVSVTRAKNLLNKVNITNEDALQVMKKYLNNEKAFLYLDPPYKGANVGSYSDIDFSFDEFIKLLKKAKCKWLLSHYFDEDLISFLGKPAASFLTFVSPSPKGKPRKVKEFLWRNYDVPISTIDFMYSEKPLCKSQKILERYGSLSFSEFNKNRFKSWSETTLKIQFGRLKYYKYNYWDGERVYFVGNKRRKFFDYNNI